MLSKPTKPRIIVYEFSGLDYVEGVGDNIESLGAIYENNEVYERIIESINPNFAKAINTLHSYRYNSLIHKVLIDSKEVAPPYYGYVPLYGQKKDGAEIKLLGQDDVIDNYKIEIMKEFVSLCKNKGVLLIGVSSPLYGTKEDKIDSLSSLLFLQADVPFLDYTTATYDTDLFIDNGHMNDKGATWFTSRIASDLKNILK